LNIAGIIIVNLGCKFEIKEENSLFPKIHSKIILMKKIGISLIIVLMSVAAFAQTKAERKEAKKAKKEAKLKEDIASAEVLVAIIESKRFVLEANTLYDKSGQSYNLNSSINFVGFDGESSTIQLAFEQLVGWNGVGGVTLDGKISQIEVKQKEGSASFSVDARVNNKGGGMVTMIFRVSSNGSARVDMSGSFGDRLSFQGNIVPLSNTAVYKGTATF
jgi:hypothetical protein